MKDVQYFMAEDDKMNWALFYSRHFSPGSVEESFFLQVSQIPARRYEKDERRDETSASGGLGEGLRVVRQRDVGRPARRCRPHLSVCLLSRPRRCFITSRGVSNTATGPGLPARLAFESLSLYTYKHVLGKRSSHKQIHMYS